MARGGQGARVTLSALAQAVGISKAAASMAINNRPGISEATRQRVLAKARELGYRPNLAAREVASGIGTSIGIVLTPTRPEPESPNYYAAELLAGAEQEATALGYQLRVTAWDAALLRPPEEHGLAGVMYMGGSFDPAVVAKTAVPSLLVGTFFPQWPYDAVLADNSRGAYLAATHLLSSGHRKIAFVNGPRRTRTSELKFLGYQEGLAEFGIEVDPKLIRVGDFSVDSGYSAIQDLLEQGARPDGVFVADDPMAIGAIHALQDAGLAVPNDVRVVGYGGSPAGAVLRPSLSTVRVFQRRMGSLAVRQLVQRLAFPSSGYLRILVAPELVVRDSSSLPAVAEP